jgi:hypothetical protein
MISRLRYHIYQPASSPDAVPIPFTSRRKYNVEVTLPSTSAKSVAAPGRLAMHKGVSGKPTLGRRHMLFVNDEKELTRMESIHSISSSGWSKRKLAASSSFLSQAK